MATSESFVTRPPQPGLVVWLKKNLFSNWLNTLLTVFSVTVIFLTAKGLVNWIFVQADWAPVVQNLRLYAVGPYPAEQMWRVWVIVYMVSAMMGISAGKWGGTVLAFARAMGISYLLLALLPVALEYLGINTRLMLAGNLLAILAGYLAGSRLERRNRLKARWVLLAWLASFVLTILLLGGFQNVAVLPRVESGQWGGLMLTFLLATVGILASFPIGVLLALGRQSKLPVVKAMCITFIEVVRGVPLVTILFMTSILLPLFLPDTLRIDRVLRAMLGMTLFAAAYMAENVRGGLQSISRGQYEAAHAMGLNNFQTTLLIILPQALRVVIPAIVGQFIALFMDTTLAIIIGLLELLAVGSAILNSNPQWLLLDMEVYAFIALIFWVFTYSMAYASRRLEHAVGLGVR
jgi:general L-amino acid transport system permease protein